MRDMLFLLGLLAACSRTNKPPAISGPTMLLGRVPTTSSYRLIACTLGSEKKPTCESMLGQLVGTELRGLHGTSVKVTKVGVIQASDGNVPTIELATPTETAVVSGPAALLEKPATLTGAEAALLRTRVRAISPRATWATDERFEIRALEADLDGDHAIDRVVIGTIVDTKLDAQRVVVGIAVGLAGKPFEIVDMAADRVQLVATVDLDGDGRDEVLIDRTTAGDARHYHYELMHAVPWQAYDMVEDTDRDEGPPM